MSSRYSAYCVWDGFGYCRAEGVRDGMGYCCAVGIVSPKEGIEEEREEVKSLKKALSEERDKFYRKERECKKLWDKVRHWERRDERDRREERKKQEEKEQEERKRRS